uniref:Matrix metallopeptidase 11 n=1 Tax=Ficedula albicollis TaxID=59894 RepID=U3JXH9_FICAL
AGPREHSVSRAQGHSVSRAQEHSVSRAQGHSVSRAQGHSVSRAQGHSVSRAQGHSVSRAQGHSVSRAQGHSVSRAQGHSVSRAQGHSVSRAQGHSVSRAQGHSVSRAQGPREHSVSRAQEHNIFVGSSSGESPGQSGALHGHRHRGFAFPFQDVSRKHPPWKEQAPWLSALVNAVAVPAKGLPGGAGAAWNPPRCGVPDLPPLPGRNRQKRFVLSGGRWDKTNLTYRIIRFPWQLVKAKVRRTIEEALKVWSDVTPLTFTEVQEGRADIVIDFTRYWHGDNLPFDGPGGILAHAFFPKTHREGDVHFDYDETWTIGNSLGTDLLQVAAHEFGHVLGLQHTAVSKSLMSPFYIFRYPLSLSEDDKQGIQHLYGKPSPEPEPTPTPTPTQPAEPPQPGLETNEITNVEAGQPDACHTAFDAAATIRGELFFFRSRYVWRLRAGKLQDGYPALASRHWQGGPLATGRASPALSMPPLRTLWATSGFSKILNTGFMMVRDGYLVPRRSWSWGSLHPPCRQLWCGGLRRTRSTSSVEATTGASAPTGARWTTSTPGPWLTGAASRPRSTLPSRMSLVLPIS